MGAAQFNCQAIECLEGQVAVAEPEVGLEQQVGMREAPVYRRRLSPGVLLIRRLGQRDGLAVVGTCF